MTTRRLIPLGEGAYTVSEVCRILGSGMTPRRIHYWMNTGLLSDPLVWGRRGHPTLLTFRQVLQIRTVQYIRDELGFPLPVVRDAFAFILSHLFADEPTDVRFYRGVNRQLLVQASTGATMTVPGGQGVLESIIPELNRHVSETRSAWEDQALAVGGFDHIVSNPRIRVGAPTVRGTRVETATLAAFGEDGHYTGETVAELFSLYPAIPVEAIEQALVFEGLARAA